MSTVRALDVVVGAGFSGLHRLHRLRGAGMSVAVVEEGDGVGGTWYWNRCPGAWCDAGSPCCSFSPELEQEWEWTDRHPTQPGILRCLGHVADRSDLRRALRPDTEAEVLDVAELLTPWDHPVGTKRTCVDTDYYAMFNRENAPLVDVRPAPVTRMIERGLSTAEREHEVGPSSSPPASTP